ncbi:MAG: hypothetical protein HY360_23515 [Verrucomicrobia bacterium]|nr:hypothetical protein [Verrucomicrobiota bacterium]
MAALFGILLFLVGTAGGFMLAGGNPLALICFASIVAIILAPLGSAFLAFGFRDVWNAIAAFRFFFFTPPVGIVFSRSSVVIRFLIFATYAISGLMFLFYLVLTLAQYGGPVGVIGARVADSICSLIYPIFLSEGLLRPLKHRLEYLAEQR